VSPQVEPVALIDGVRPDMIFHSQRGPAMLVSAVACWGAGTVTTKQALGEVPPLTLLPIQLLVSCVVLLFGVGDCRQPQRGQVQLHLDQPVGYERLGHLLGGIALVDPMLLLSSGGRNW
jgi:hypothetical protein